LATVYYFNIITPVMLQTQRIQLLPTTVYQT